MNNPVLEKADAETNRQITIAKILNLKRHNRTKVGFDLFFSDWFTAQLYRYMSYYI